MSKYENYFYGMSEDYWRAEVEAEKEAVEDFIKDIEEEEKKAALN